MRGARSARRRASCRAAASCGRNRSIRRVSRQPVRPALRHADLDALQRRGAVRHRPVPAASLLQPGSERGCHENVRARCARRSHPAGCGRPAVRRINRQRMAGRAAARGSRRARRSTASALADLATAGDAQVDAAIDAAADAFTSLALVPAPARGEFVRRFGEQLREHKPTLATLVTWEAGKITPGGARRSAGDDRHLRLRRRPQPAALRAERSPASARAIGLTEQWHPLGPVGVITAFNFPVAVWAWNAAIALVCGDPVVWKPSEKTPLTRDRLPAARSTDDCRSAATFPRRSRAS